MYTTAQDEMRRDEAWLTWVFQWRAKLVSALEDLQSEPCAEHPQADMEWQCVDCATMQMNDIEELHRSECEAAYEAGKRHGYEEGLEEGKRWEQ
jgi:flagellar biosynthesis/type III secretory pathway protein FliH